MKETLSIDEGKIDRREDGGPERSDVMLLCSLYPLAEETGVQLELGRWGSEF